MLVPNGYELFNEKYYADLPGGILENFENDLKIYVHPLHRSLKTNYTSSASTIAIFISDVPAANSKRAGGNR